MQMNRANSKGSYEIVCLRSVTSNEIVAEAKISGYRHNLGNNGVECNESTKIIRSRLIGLKPLTTQKWCEHSGRFSPKPLFFKFSFQTCLTRIFTRFLLFYFNSSSNLPFPLFQSYPLVSSYILHFAFRFLSLILQIQRLLCSHFIPLLCSLSYADNQRFLLLPLFH